MTNKHIERIRLENQLKDNLGSFQAVLTEANINIREKDYNANEWAKIRKLEWEKQKPILKELASKGNKKAQGILKSEGIVW